jgi:hypothetical protein
MKPIGCIATLMAVLILAGSPAARAQAPQQANQTTGIPGSVTLEPGGSVTFSSASQSLQVRFQHSDDPHNDVPSVAASFDGETLSITGPNLAAITILPPLGPSTCAAVNGLPNAVRCSISAGQVAFIARVVPCRGGFDCPVTVHYPAGWNLLAVTRSGNVSTTVNSNIGPFYTWQAGDTEYPAVSGSGGLEPGAGYWAYFDQPTAVNLQSTAQSCCPLLDNAQPPPFTVDLPAGQFITIGDPYSVPASVAGADAVYTYDPTTGSYQATTTLQPGQGAWAYSAGGGTITISPTTS